MKVDQITWSELRAVAFVDGIECRIRRSDLGYVLWRCAEHGLRHHAHCQHLLAFADADPDPAAYRRRTTAEDFNQGKETDQ